jgi:hypothetical protein
MVDRILHGQTFIFFAGQSYNGALEQYLQAAFYLLPIPRDPTTLRLPQILLAGLACWLVYLVGCRILPSRWHAALAAAIYALGPYWNIFKGAHSDGAYLSTQVVIIVAMYCAVHLTGVRTDHRIWVLCIGLCIGLTAWLGLSGFIGMVPIALWAGASVIRSRFAFLLAAAGLLIGAVPVIAFAVRHATIPTVVPAEGGLTYLARTRIFFRHIVPEFLGVDRLPAQRNGIAILSGFVMASVVALVLLAAFRRRRGLWDLLTLRTEHRRPIDIVIMTFLLMPWLYASNDHASFIGDPRYLFSLFPMLALGLAALLPMDTLAETPAHPAAATRLTSPTRTRGALRRRARSHRRGLAQSVALLLVCVLLAANSVGTVLGERTARSPATNSDLRAAGSYLLDHGMTHAYADYWTALPISYLSRGTVAVATVGPGHNRFTDIQRSVAAADHFVYVESSRSGNRLDIGIRLRAHHVTFKEIHIGPVTIFSELVPAVRPPALDLIEPS